ncbi:hypothetical protein ABK905_06765 [Acerihabitans sp. KWT182]|uniref:PBP domain-containing protein n=1 Tax=Acerihabitans sp. KWT182 TaxID=3157919 RepID=A0AAU7QC31_9GAMM
MTHRCGPSPTLASWGDLGLKGPWAEKALLRYGRNSASGTYGYFRQRALCGGDLLPSVNELPGSVSVAQAVAGSVNAIGYAGMGFKAGGVKILALTDGRGKTVQPDDATLLNGDYPLVRYLYIYVNKAPDRSLEPITAAFFRPDSLRRRPKPRPPERISIPAGVRQAAGATGYRARLECFLFDLR